MILTKDDYINYVKCDACANWRTTCRAKLFGDESWKFILCMRRLEYWKTFSGIKKVLFVFPVMLNKLRFHRLSVLNGYSIPIGVCGKGLALPHRGTIVINREVKIGENCRIHQGVTIGSTSGSTKAARIGNNVFIGANASIIGDIDIADDVAIGANSVVTKSIKESKTTWGGIPARKISENDSHSNLSPLLFEEDTRKMGI